MRNLLEFFGLGGLIYWPRAEAAPSAKATAADRAREQVADILTALTCEEENLRRELRRVDAELRRVSHERAAVARAHASMSNVRSESQLSASAMARLLAPETEERPGT